MSGFFGRMTRKWWLMLVVGMAVGIASGLTVAEKMSSGRLVGTASPPAPYITVHSGEYFAIFTGEKSGIITWDEKHLTYKGDNHSSFGDTTTSFDRADRKFAYAFIFQAIKPTGSNTVEIGFGLEPRSGYFSKDLSYWVKVVE